VLLNQGQVLASRYRIVKLLGNGGYGAVYRAWDLTLHQPCALKQNLATSYESQRQFEREAIILAGLRHTGLPRVTDHFEIQNQGQFLIMDFINGKDLEKIITDDPGVLPEEQVVDWINQVCLALQYLHNHQPPVIHRDVKPQNIIITAENQAILVDFGIFKLYDPILSTTAGARGVTSGFSPPEQYGKGKTDARSDIYSVGATLYFALSRHYPPDAIERVVGHDRLIPPQVFNSSISEPIQSAILTAMQIDPQDRFSSIAEFIYRLQIDVSPIQTPYHVQAEEKQVTGSAIFSDSLIGQPLDPSSRQDEQVIPSHYQKVLPAGVKRVAWFCILSSLLIGLARMFFPGYLSEPLLLNYFLSGGYLYIFVMLIFLLSGLFSGVLLMRSSRWGRRLAILYLLFLILNYGLEIFYRFY